MIEEIWDAICESIAYLFSFEWFGDLWEVLGSMFENISEFSVTGVVFGIIGAGTIFVARDYMLGPFLVHMSPMAKIFWGLATYIGCFAAGYLVGKHFENT